MAALSELSRGWRIVFRILIAVDLAAILAGSHWAMYQQGKVKGYAQASKDRATQTYQASKQSVTNTYVYHPKRSFALLSIGPWALLSKESTVVTPVVTQTVSTQQTPAPPSLKKRKKK